MLSPKPHTNARKAQEYFEEHLAVGDYYSEGQVVAGEWFGEGARMLALSGRVKRDEFVALCENCDPRTGEKLTARTKTTRKIVRDDQSESQVANRRLFYDFAISPPKSVSIAALVAGDNRIVAAHDRAVCSALRQLERFAATRVRKGGKYEDRTTRNVVAAMFRHDTSRALDPHLHSHCIVFNATFDPVEKRWKALQNRGMYFARKYVENVYYHELVRELKRFGYRIRNQVRGDFELEGMSASLLEKFSKRHRQIDAQTRELLAKRPELAGRNLAEVREHIAHNKRARKSSSVGLGLLQKQWDEELSGHERECLERLRQNSPKVPDHAPAVAMDEQAALRWAEEHLFDRRSLVHEHELWSSALERARGEDFTVGQLHTATEQAGYVRDKANPQRLTTSEVLRRELEIICLAKDGRGACPRLFEEWGGGKNLDTAQREAARQLLRSRDFVSLFRGGAGTGKSFTLRTVFDALKDIACPVQVIAPQRQQVRDLEHDGLNGSQTVSEFLTRRNLPKGAVVIVDEAGQIGARQMLDFLAFVQERGGRVILSGDTRQHGAVQASDALWAIEKYAGLPVAELKEIRRQDPARGKTMEEKQRIGIYRQAVEAASDGDIAASYSHLETMEAVVECAPDDQQDKLAEEYVKLAKAGENTLVVSPTWDEIHRVNERVREGLQAEGLIGKRERTVTSLQNVDLTDAQKLDPRYYPENAVLVFNRKLGSIGQGQTANLLAASERGVVLEAGERVHTISRKFVNHFTVCRPKDLALSKGDRLQLKSNGKTADGQRLANGELVTVRRFKKDGRMVLQDGRVLEPEYRQFVRGYAVTSYASQGKTVDHVLFSDSGVKAATNDQQWYVTISRGRKGVKIFTSDKEALQENVLRSGKRELALDIVVAESPTPELQPKAARRRQNLRERFDEVFLRWHASREQRARARVTQTSRMSHTP